MTDRDCANCKHHTEDGCSSWDCEFEAKLPKGELISKADAIELLTEIVFDEPPYFDSETLCRLYAEEQINKLPSADAEPTVIRSKTLMPTKDFTELAKRIKEENPNAIVIPCDAEVVSAVPQLKQTDTLIIADALRYLAKDTERHLVDRTRADALRQQFLKYGASMCKGGEDE